MSNKIVPLEEQEQATLFEWAELQKGRYPELKFMFAIPNGGHRHIKTAIMLKKTGVKSGVPDIFLPTVKGKYAGLFIELKRKVGGKVSTEQESYINYLNTNGYCVMVCRGWQEAAAKIVAYLDK